MTEGLRLNCPFPTSSLRGALGFGRSATRGDDCPGPKEDSHAPPTPSPSQTRPPFSSHASASDPKVSASNAPWPGGRPFRGFTVASAPTWEGSGERGSTAHLPARPARELNGGPEELTSPSGRRTQSRGVALVPSSSTSSGLAGVGPTPATRSRQSRETAGEKDPFAAAKSKSF